MDTVMASFVQVLLHSEVAILNHVSEITAISFSENFSKISHHDIAKIKGDHRGMFCPTRTMNVHNVA